VAIHPVVAAPSTPRVFAAVKIKLSAVVLKTVTVIDTASAGRSRDSGFGNPNESGTVMLGTGASSALERSNPGCSP